MQTANFPAKVNARRLVAYLRIGTLMRWPSETDAEWGIRLARCQAEQHTLASRMHDSPENARAVRTKKYRGARGIMMKNV